MLAQETMLRVAARYPASAVVEIAEALAGTSNETDIRLAQFTLDDLLRDIPDLGSDPKALGIAVASKMLEQRSQRLEQVQIAQRARLDAERVAMELGHQQDEKARAEREKQMRYLERRIDELGTESQTSKAAADLAGKRSRRRLVQVTLMFGLVGAALIAAVLWQVTDAADALFGGLSIALTISAIVLVLASESWVEDPSVTSKRLLFALLPQIIAIPGLLESLGVKLPWD